MLWFFIDSICYSSCWTSSLRDCYCSRLYEYCSCRYLFYFSSFPIFWISGSELYGLLELALLLLLLSIWAEALVLKLYLFLYSSNSYVFVFNFYPLFFLNFSYSSSNIILLNFISSNYFAIPLSLVLRRLFYYCNSRKSASSLEFFFDIVWIVDCS